MSLTDHMLDEIWSKRSPSQKPVITFDSTHYKSQAIVSMTVIDDDLVVARTYIDWSMHPPGIQTEFIEAPMGTVCYMADDYRDTIGG